MNAIHWIITQLLCCVLKSQLWDNFFEFDVHMRKENNLHKKEKEKQATNDFHSHCKEKQTSS